jgi:hypothetical protein
MIGYHRVAEFMSAHGEIAILRRFGRLNMLNLMYLQAEITNLEHELDEMASQNPNIKAAKDWVTLSESTHDEDRLQWALTLELRKKLSEFSKNPTRFHVVIDI